MTEQEKREKVIKGLERCIEKLDTVINKSHGFNCTACPYFRQCDASGYLIGFPLMKDVLALLKAQELANYIPIDWLMNYAQLPTEFAISAWRKPKKEAEIKQVKSLDKPMSLDDALNLVNDVFPLGQKEQEAR